MLLSLPYAGGVIDAGPTVDSVRTLCCGSIPKSLVLTLWPSKAFVPCECLVRDGIPFIEPIVLCLEWQESECVNEVQTLTIGGGVPTTGTFRLSFLGSETIELNWNATAAEVKTALEDTAFLLVGDIATAGGPLPGSAITITFQGDRACENVARIIVSYTNLDFGVTLVTNTTQGGSSWKICDGSITGLDWSELCCARHFCARLLCNENDIVVNCNSIGLQVGCYDEGVPGHNCKNQVWDLVTPYAPLCCACGAGCPCCDEGTFWKYCPAESGDDCKCGQGPNNYICYQVDAPGTSVAWDTGCTCPRYNGTDEEQRISASGVVSGGTFTLTFDGQTTAPLNWNATPAQVCTALKALSSVPDTNCVFCTSLGQLPINAIVVKFTCCLGGRDVPLMTVDDDLITGGGGIIITTDIAGVAPGSWTCADETFTGCVFTCDDIGEPDGIENCCCPCMPSTLTATFIVDPLCTEWATGSCTLTHTIVNGLHCWECNTSGDGFRLCCDGGDWIGSFFCNGIEQVLQGVNMLNCSPFETDDDACITGGLCCGQNGPFVCVQITE